MPRRLIPFVPNTYYHIYNRGNNREKIFFEQANYLYFLRGLKKYIQPIATINTYCLMPTHYHLVLKVEEVQTPEISPEESQVLDSTKQISGVLSRLTPLSRAMKNFLISYTKGINLRYSRIGTLFQGAFKSKAVETYSYLMNLCVYIHANPVKDGLVEEIRDWPYSNYLEWIGERSGTLVDRKFVRTSFGSPADYQNLVMDYLKSRSLPEDVRRYLQSLEE
jgi:REP element-mobilizing transposase RayT